MGGQGLPLFCLSSIPGLNNLVSLPLQHSCQVVFCPCFQTSLDGELTTSQGRSYHFGIVDPEEVVSATLSFPVSLTQNMFTTPPYGSPSDNLITTILPLCFQFKQHYLGQSFLKDGFNSHA